MSDNNDLIGLIDEASKSLSGEAAQPSKHFRIRGNSMLGRFAAMALVPVAAFHFVDSFTVDDLSDIAVETQLINILHTAQNSINAVMRGGGDLPPYLPNAALANIVNYSIDGNRYVLSAESNGITISLDSSGNLTTVIEN